MVSDMFYPNVGGVESHLYCLSLELMRRGHKVIIITHAYGDRKGVRYLTSGVKVYYLSHWLVYDQVSLPTLYCFFPLFRYIVIRESIDIVHGHQSILNAKTMGIPALHGSLSTRFEDVSSTLMNKLLKFTLSDVDHVICVSHTSKENTVLRAALDPRTVSVIPNAVVPQDFMPESICKDPTKVLQLHLLDWFYRKGTDLLIAIIPKICAQFPELEQMREKYVLQDRVTVLGAVKHSDVRKTLTQGHIFLNTSLTEAFWHSHRRGSMLWASSCQHKVGGVPEVLPDHMMDLIESVKVAIKRIKENKVDPIQFHNEIKMMYSWSDVAERTEKVYRKIVHTTPGTLLDRFIKYDKVGPAAGKFSIMIVAVSYLLLCILEWLVPSKLITRAPTFSLKKYHEVCSQMAKKKPSLIRP
ncbi:hypothetical protein BC829DRAFT_390158 [Chytridium lagenaria]|nr:hypothetical protein BC829DRAFT_390158 [Chytridium lagenaria]